MCLLRDWDKFIDLQRERVKNLGVKKAVIGVSGGCDSTVSLALLVRLLGKDNVYAILLPNGEQSGINVKIIPFLTMVFTLKMVNKKCRYKIKKKTI